MTRTTGDQLPCEEDPDTFFSEGEYNTAWAKAACATCPIREACLQMALENDEPHGIWGGLTAQERRLMRPDQVRSITSVEDAA